MIAARPLPDGIHYSPEGIAERWLEAFAPEDELRARISNHGDNLWHVFFYRECPCLTGPDARAAYDEAVCPQVLFFELGSRGKSGYIAHELILADKSSIPSDVVCTYADAFVVASDFSWTYVHSHEGDDFFCRRRS